MKYIALLRGINVGGNKKVPMVTLKNCFEDLGYSDVVTLLNSGNVVFSSDKKDVTVIKKEIEERIEKIFGFSVSIQIITQIVLKDMVSQNPFAKVRISDSIQRYVTFIPDKQSLKNPQVQLDTSFKIVKITERALFSVLTLSKVFSSTEAMKALDKIYGTSITTRNWNTVVKLANL